MKILALAMAEFNINFKMSKNIQQPKRPKSSFLLEKGASLPQTPCSSELHECKESLKILTLYCYDYIQDI